MKHRASQYEGSYCCLASGMLHAADTTAATDMWDEDVNDSSRSTPGRISTDSRELLSTVTVELTTEEGAHGKKGVEGNSGSAIAHLARFMDLSDEDMRVLSYNKLTLGKLERLSAGDLNALGMTNPLHAIGMVRAAPALATLRQFKPE